MLQFETRSNLAAVRTAWVGLLVTTALASASWSAPITTAILQSNYEVTVEYTDGHGTADAIVLPISTVPGNHSAAFRFRDPRDAEVLVRLVDGCAVNGHYWFLATSLTELPYTIRVVESPGGAVQTYTNPAGLRRAFADTTSFPCPPRSSAITAARSTPAFELTAASAPHKDFGLIHKPERGFFCFPDVDTACLFGTNFPVEVDFSSALGSGDAFAHDPNLSERTTLFGLAADDIPDVAVKVIDTCSHYEVHWAQLGNVTLDISVVSYLSGLTWNSPSTIDNGVDRQAFVIDSSCIFAGSFEMGTPYEWSASTP